MTGSELRRIRNSLELSRVAFGRALGYRGENVDRMIRRLAAGERKITEEVAEIARKLWLAPARERTARASRYLGTSSEGARPRSPEDGVAPAAVHHDRGLPFGGWDNLVMEYKIRQLGRLAMVALVCCFVALAVRANLFALIFGAETAVAVLWAIWLAKWEIAARFTAGHHSEITWFVLAFGFRAATWTRRRAAFLQGAVIMYAVDANAAVQNHPEEWSFVQWPVTPAAPAEGSWEMLFRAEIHISGNTPREQRLAIAADLKRMAEKVILDNAPLSGAARVTISNGDKLAGEGWFEAGLLGRVVAWPRVVRRNSPKAPTLLARNLNQVATAVVDSARASEQTDIVEKLTLPVIAENQLGVVRSDQDLHQALRDRANQLNIARETIDEIAGLTPGHASKLLAPQQIKRFGPHPPEG